MRQASKFPVLSFGQLCRVGNAAMIPTLEHHAFYVGVHVLNNLVRAHAKTLLFFKTSFLWNIKLFVTFVTLEVAHPQMKTLFVLLEPLL